jgi:hypothetical protein
MMRASLSFAARLAALLLTMHGSCAVAQTRYEFFLDSAPGVVIGSGFLSVDDSSIPLHGAASVRASTFEGTVGRPIGYSQGNTFTTISFHPNEVVNVVKTDTNASISFQDHVPVGIGYDEVHTVAVDGCSSCFFAFEITMIGADWVLTSGHGGDRGTIRFATPVPEPITLVLMLSGLWLVAWTTRRRRAA